MKIGNIVYENELVNHIKVNYINYYNEEISYEDIDKTLPTLYVGWIFMKVCNLKTDFIKKVDILNKVIFDDLKWEFSFEENKSSHINGVNEFVNSLPNNFFTPKYTYIDLDPVYFQIKDVDDFIDIIPKKIDSYYNYKNEMVYLLVNNKITGINLLFYDYFKFNINDIKLKLFERTENKFDDFNSEMFMQFYKIFPNFTHLKRYMVTMLKK